MRKAANHTLIWIKRHKYWVLGGAFLVLLALCVVFYLVMRGPSLEERVLDHPNDKKVLTEVAAEYMARNDYGKARELYNDLLEAEKSNADAFLGIAATYVAEAEGAETLKRQELREEARVTLRKLIAAQPSEPRGYVELSKLLNKEEAIALLQNAQLYLQSDPTIESALQALRSE